MIKPLLPIILLDECSSTNDEAAKMLSFQELPFVVSTRKQTSGRGRLNRAWFSLPKASICFSLAVDVSFASADILASSTVRVGIAVCQALNKICKNPLFLKWPNDIYTADGRKLAGMLAELHSAKQGGYNIVFGIGLNYDLSKSIDEVPAEISSIIADIRPLLSDDFSRNDILALVVNAAAAELARHDMQTLADFSAVDYLRGRSVDISIGDRRFSGVADGINEKGNLRVRLPDTSIEIVNSGEATLHK